MSETRRFTYLAPREGSHYEQYFFAAEIYAPKRFTAPRSGRSRCRSRKWPRITTCRSLLCSRLFSTQPRMPRFFSVSGKKTSKKATPEVWLVHRL